MDSCPTASIILPVVATLITSLDNHTGDSPFIKQIKNALRASIEERFRNLFADRAVSFYLELRSKIDKFHCRY